MSKKRSRTEKPAPTEVFSIPEYCALERISRSRLYAEWRAGHGPKFFRRGRRILISKDAAEEYRARLEAESAGMPYPPAAA